MDVITYPCQDCPSENEATLENMDKQVTLNC